MTTVSRQAVECEARNPCAHDQNVIKVLKARQRYSVAPSALFKKFINSSYPQFLIPSRAIHSVSFASFGACTPSGRMLHAYSASLHFLMFLLLFFSLRQFPDLYINPEIEKGAARDRCRSSQGCSCNDSILGRSSH